MNVLPHQGSTQLQPGGRSRNLAQKARVISDSSRDIEPAFHFRDRRLAVSVFTKRQNVCQPKQNLLGLPCFKGRVPHDGRDRVLPEARRLRGRSLSVPRYCCLCNFCFRVKIILQRVQGHFLQPWSISFSQFWIQRLVERQQQFQLRISSQTRGWLMSIPRLPVTKSKTVRPRKKATPPAPESDINVARYVLQHTARHFTFLRIQRIAKVNQQHRNLWIIQSVERQRNHFDRLRAGSAAATTGDSQSRSNESPRNLSNSKGVYRPGIRDVQESGLDYMAWLGLKIAFAIHNIACVVLPSGICKGSKISDSASARWRSNSQLCPRTSRTAVSVARCSAPNKVVDQAAKRLVS